MTACLLYHDVAEPADADRMGFPGAVAGRYKLTPTAFEAHLEAIAATGAAVKTLLPEPVSDPQCAFTFDDGGASALLAADALERRGWRGHFFVTTGRIDTPGFLTSDGVRELAARGHVVGSHSHGHPTYMGRLSRAEIDREWGDSRDRLADLLGARPAAASLPGGYLSQAVIDGAAAAGYALLMTSQPVTRVQRRDGLTVRGRFSMWSSTPAARAAAYARAQRLARARLWAEWKAKGAAKRVIGRRLYEPLRRLRAPSR